MWKQCGNLSLFKESLKYFVTYADLIILQEFYWKISFFYCFWAIKGINLFCKICKCNSTECKPLSIYSSNRKYTWMIPPFHNCFQSRMVYVIWKWVSILCDSGKFRLVTILENKLFKAFATFSSSVISSSSSIRVIFSEETILLERNDFTVYQKDLLSTTLFTHFV